MNCSQARQRISALMDNALDGQRQRELLSHLDTCAACRTYKKELSLLREAVRTPGTITPSPDFFAKVQRRIKAPAAIAVPRPVRRHWAAAATMAAAIMTALLAGNFFGKSLSSEFWQATASENEVMASSLGQGALNDIPEGSIAAVYNEMRG